MKGEIRVKKDDFWGDLGWGGGWGGLDLVCESATPPTHIWERLKKTYFFWIFFNSLYTVMTMQSLTKPASPQVGPFVYQALTIKDTVEEDGKSNLRYNEDGTTLTYRPRSLIK